MVTKKERAGAIPPALSVFAYSSVSSISAGMSSFASSIGTSSTGAGAGCFFTGADAFLLGAALLALFFAGAEAFAAGAEDFFTDAAPFLPAQDFPFHAHPAFLPHSACAFTAAQLSPFANALLATSDIAEETIPINRHRTNDAFIKQELLSGCLLTISEAACGAQLLNFER